MTTGSMNFDRNCELSPADDRFANCIRIKLPKYGNEPVATGGGDPMSQAVEAYKSLRSRLMKARDGRAVSSIVVTSTAQSDGKTLTAYNLAYCCAQLEDITVLLVDADLRTQGLTALTGNQHRFGLRDVLSGSASYESAVVGTDVPSLHLMGAGTGNESPAELLSGTGWGQFMAWASESFKLVLVDSPPIGVVADLNLIEAGCSGSLIVVRAHKTLQRTLEDALGQIDSKKVLGVVWNDDNQTPERYSYSYRKA